MARHPSPRRCCLRESERREPLSKPCSATIVPRELTSLPGFQRHLSVSSKPSIRPNLCLSPEMMARWHASSTRGWSPRHPLLAGTIVDERDFDSGDDTPVDLAGHGTRIAGIIVYGDVAACLHTGRWEPQVRLLNAKILRALSGGIAVFSDDNEKRIETQVREAITYFAREFGCRVFNLSLGHYSRTYHEGRQLPWALVLDELARDLDVVLVVAAGNVISPAIPSLTTSEDFQREVSERLLTRDHALTDPACAVNVLTVGAIARTDVPFDAQRYPQRRPPLVAHPPWGRLRSLARGLSTPMREELGGRSNRSWWPTAATTASAKEGMAGT